MFYKWNKYLAAHFILKILSEHPTTLLGSEETPMYAPFFRWINLQQIKQRTNIFSITTLRDAAWMLYEKKEIDILNNEKHQFDIRLRTFSSGIIALKDKEYIWKIAWFIVKIVGYIGAGLIGSIQLYKVLKTGC